MNPISVVGAFIITLSFLSYGVGSIYLLRFKKVSSVVLIYLTLGICFDFTAILCMIAGADDPSFTPHGILGYIAFLLMLISTIGMWRIYLKHGKNAPVEKRFMYYSRFAYLFWVIAYFTGSLIVIWR